ncbi:MAG TPA: outer membrane beta-barrel family protein [Phnomibacter sp.]|nr:outer membrane beta-barrel family protein [Phnomibacter sp.]
MKQTLSALTLLFIFQVSSLAQQPGNPVNQPDTALAATDPLAQVTVIAKMQATSIEPGKVIFNVAGLPVAYSGSAGDLLKFMPSVNMGGPPGVPRDVRYRGLEKSYTLVLIDGRNTGLTGNNREMILNQIPASAIERIEIMASPGAEYDAEGLNGVINIVLKKNKGLGLKANAQVGLTNQGGYNASVGLQHQTNNLKLYAQADYLLFRWRKNGGMVETRNITNYNSTGAVINTQQQTATEWRQAPNINLRTGGEFRINPYSILGMEYLHGSQKEHRIKPTATTTNKPDGSFSNRTLRHEDRLENLRYHQARVWWQHKLANGNKLDVEINGTYNLDDRPRTQIDYKLNQNGTPLDNKPDIRYITESARDNNLFATANYAHRLTNRQQLQLGYKYSHRQRIASFFTDRFNYNTNQYNRTESGTDNFNYAENIQAFYAKHLYKHQHWRIETGIRMEYTSINTQTPEKTYTATSHYVMFMPGMQATYTIDSTQYLVASVGRRMRRAGFKDLNPFTDMSDPNKYKSGNAQLKPETAWLTELGYLKNFKKGSWGLNLFRRDITHMISKINRDYLLPDGTNILFEKPENLASAYLVGIEWMGGYKLGKWIALQANYSRFWSRVTDKEFNGDAIKDQFDWSAKAIVDVTTPWGTSLQIAGNAIGPKISQQKIEKTMQFVDVAITQRLHKSITAFASVYDLFNSNNQYRTEVTAQQHSYRIQDSPGQIISIGARATF